MRSIVYIFSLIFSILSRMIVSSIPAEGIIQLTDKNFEQITQASTGQTTGKWFVFFSSKKCPHCTALHPKWQTLSEKLEMDHPDSSVLLAIVDVTENPGLLQRFGIKSMPTMYYFADRGMYEYPPRSPRNVDHFLEYVLGGYTNGEKRGVPTNPRLLQMVADFRNNVHHIKFLHFLLDDIEEILLRRKNAAILLFFSGTLFGVLLCTLKGLLTKTKKEKNE